MRSAKKLGFSDCQIATLVLTSELEGEVGTKRKSLGITPFQHHPAHTNYLYTTYHATEHDLEFDENGTMVLGTGVYRIGSSVEFDWCTVTCVRKVREMGKKTVMIKYNQETVSTDFDEADQLYFFEIVMDIYELELAQGVITLNQAGIDQQEWVEVSWLSSPDPTYVLSGAAMNVVWDRSTLEHSLTAAAEVSSEHPFVLTKFIAGAQEIDVDGVAHEGKLLVHAVFEHVENAGVHSGDATSVLLPFSLEVQDMSRLKEIA
ncbi:uncharacterized protein MELLADRAFT_104736 [Melampsora larici-populina 98AG31]|uniref:Carbamoyl-phosphate synthetase large subunit oligomerisation domain-containing protein n=1 Tax=Melampsora larici-populina (strain 98AG31 / pathotype 3-4-7) TaxID=747676 RepID=F4RFR1_MELLP|nr:uncharacterized protein MELLADRAFT_104736 [Melampsora larici-populina 98AG31]EGG08853.1 hypothetical protein MELLADRAFT_104736 [Melampsora larici-populina 98AG31]